MPNIPVTFGCNPDENFPVSVGHVHNAETNSIEHTRVVRMDTGTDYYWTVNGNRYVNINDTILADFLEMKYQLLGFRTTEAEFFLYSMGFTREDALEYLDSLPKREYSTQGV